MEAYLGERKEKAKREKNNLIQAGLFFILHDILLFLFIKPFDKYYRNFR